MLGKNKNWWFFALLLFSFFSCENRNTKELNSIVEKAYKKCKGKKDCTIDFKTSFPFEWDKMYVFGSSITKKGITQIIGFTYPKEKDIERVILFINKNQIVHEIMTEYETEGFIDIKPMKVEFVGDLPEYFTPKTGKFRIEKSEDIYLLKANP